MEWTTLILGFLGQIAWPLAVLVLGLGFRRPLVELFNNGTVTKLNIGPAGVGVEWATEAGVAMAKAALESGSSEDEPDAPPNDGAPTAESPGDTSEAEGDAPAEKPEPVLIQRLPVEVVKLAHDSPIASILQSAEDLRADLLEVLQATLLGGGGSQDVSLSQVLLRANGIGLLTKEEAIAGRELALVRNRLAHADKGVRVDADTALDYARLSRRLARSARDSVNRLDPDVVVDLNRGLAQSLDR
ncbi:hypothetical protein [Kocuria kalidii]|uniref:hypothetical protein n=1 Tax=Kocuria kalidii TaxID=3376283 RepID=UPI0037A08AA1